MNDALIVVDVQNDFAHPKGSLFVEGGDKVAATVNKLQEFFEIVIYTKDWHPPVTDHFDNYGGPWPAHCVGGTWGSEFVEDLKVRDQPEVVLKGTQAGADGYSGFYAENDGDIQETTLHATLQDKDVTAVFIAGIALDVCVKATCLDALALGYDTYLYIDATAAVTEEGADKAKQELRAAGVRFI